VTAVLASIPSPSGGNIDLGPLTIHVYGLMLLLGILGATWLSGVRAVRAGACDWDFIFRLAMWGVAGGIVGARAYHVATSWSEVPDEWWGVFAVWKGGLGVWGGVAAGVGVGAVIVKRAGKSIFEFMDYVGPGLLLAQGVGRWGNYFNQELFGKPTGLPWGLEISPANRPAGYTDAATFHPTFLYEFIWDMIGVAVLLWVGRRFRIRAPGLFCLYVAWYTFARASWEEHLRVDPSHYILGQRLNAWVAIGLFLLAVFGFFWAQRQRTEPPGQGPGRGVPAGPRMAVPKSSVRRGR
jgi:prolipoprotein diacylglyceryl transferase